MFIKLSEVLSQWYRILTQIKSKNRYRCHLITLFYSLISQYKGWEVSDNTVIALAGLCWVYFQFYYKTVYCFRKPSTHLTRTWNWRLTAVLCSSTPRWWKSVCGIQMGCLGRHFIFLSSFSHSSQCSMRGVTKAVVCVGCPVCGMMHIKEPLLLIRKIAHVVVAAGFLSRYLNGPLPYVWRHITVNKMCWVHC